MTNYFNAHSTPSRHSCGSRSPVLFRAFLDSRLRGNDNVRVLNDDERGDNDDLVGKVTVVSTSLDSGFRRNDDKVVVN
jgi:hypothetical protein